MYFTSLPDHTLPGFNEEVHFSRFGKANMIFNALSSGARCDNHVGCLSIKTVVEGEEWYGIDGRMIAVRPGQFLIMNQLQEYSCRIDGGQVRTLSVFFKKDLAAVVYRAFQKTEEELLDIPFEAGGTPEFGQTLRPLDDSLRVHLLTLVGGLEYEGYEVNRVDEQMIELLECLLTEHRSDMFAVKNVGAARLSTQKEIFRRLCVARDMLHSYYREHVDLEAVSEMCYMSVPQLIRQFKLVFGSTPHRYLTAIRLQRAAELLKTSEKTINDIAWDCGFEDVSAFCRAFKKKYGVRGMEIRRSGIN